jgi:hypothetical protein
MKSRGVRVLLVVLAVAALAAAGVAVWQIEERVAAAAAASGGFEHDARQAVIDLTDLRAAQQAYVAEGQPPEAWLARAAGLVGAIGPKLSALRAAAGTAEAQAALESAAEAFTALAQSDGRAREYLRAGQRLSASDVVFGEAMPALEKAVIGIDTARGQANVAHAIALEDLRRWEIVALGAAAALVLIVVLMLAPIPAAARAAAEAEGEAEAAETPAPVKGGGLNLSHAAAGPDARRERPAAAPPRATAQPGTRTPADDGLPPIDFGLDTLDRPKAPDLDALADLCSSLARVQDTRELQGLLERAARPLDATGVIVWMPESQQGMLRPVLSHGYPPASLSRMGAIHPAADNATATAFRTKAVVAVPAEVLASGAVVAPIISADGCAGVMAAELREGADATPERRAIAAIVAAQLATLFTPAGAAETAGKP